MSLLNIACKKSSGDHIVNYTTLKVLEDKTGKPIERVTLSLQDCKSDYLSLICDEVLSGKTDGEGAFKFTTTIFTTVVADHPGYWRTGIIGVSPIGETELYMIPEAWQKVHLINNHSYQPNTIITLNSQCRENFPNPVWDSPYALLIFGITFSESLSINYPVADTTVYIRSLGAYHNYISWSVISDAGSTLISGQTPTQAINAFDTVSVQVAY